MTELSKKENIAIPIYKVLKNTEPHGISYPEFIHQLGLRGATNEEIEYVYKLRKKYNIDTYSLEDVILNNTWLKQKKHLWNLMKSAGVTTWDDLVAIESIDNIEKAIPGITLHEEMALVTYYTKERSDRGMPVDQKWADIVNGLWKEMCHA